MKALLVAGLMTLATGSALAQPSIPVSSDPRATYHLLNLSRLPSGNLQVLTRRTGSSGTSYAVREVDCRAMRFRYLGEGQTQESALIPRNPGPMSALTEGSISTEVSNFACRQR